MLSVSAVPLGPRTKDIVPIDDRADDKLSGRGGSGRYIPRNDRRRDRRDFDSRDDIVDGSYGFDDRMDTDDNNDNREGRGLYSDNLVSNRGSDKGRGDGRGGGYR